MKITRENKKFPANIGILDIFERIKPWHPGCQDTGIFPSLDSTGHFDPF